MTEKKRLLTYLVADILSDDDVIARFLANPEEVMSEYDLDAAQRCTLYSLHPASIARMASAEIEDAIGRALSANYPVPEPRITTVYPTDLRGEVPSFTVEGEGLMSHAEVILRPISGVGPSLLYKAGNASGSFQNTKLSVDKLDVRGASTGMYAVFVRNCEEADLLESPTRVQIMDRPSSAAA
jgi:hypothetical protein